MNGKEHQMWLFVIPASYRYADFDIMNTHIAVFETWRLFMLGRSFKGRRDLGGEP